MNEPASNIAKPRNHPPGWAHNPSTYRKRAVMGVIIMIALIASLGLGLAQVGVLNHPWDPFFASPLPRYANGSDRIIHSSLTRALPVPDALIGSGCYAIEIALLMIGGERRWETAPWAAAGSAIILGPAALVSLTLTILQPVAYHAWCTLCLVCAACSITLVAPAFEELLAVLQVGAARRRAGAPWRRVILGGSG